MYSMCVCLFLITLRVLSMFLATLQIFQPSFTFCTPNLTPFSTWSTTCTCLLGLEIPKHFIGLRTNATVACKQNNPMLVSASSAISGIPAKEMSQLHNKLCGWDHWIPKLRGQLGGCTSFKLPSTVGHPPLKFLLYSIFRPKGGWKTINFFSHFFELMTETNLEYFVMLGTHS